MQDLKVTAASTFATLTVTLLHPLEVLKINFQSAFTLSQGYVQKARSIWNREGLKGLFKGWQFNFLTTSLAQSIFFVIYENRKRYWKNNSLQTLFASTQAAVLGLLLTQPFWVIKTRLMLIEQQKSQLSNIVQITKQLFRQEGVKAFSRGLRLSLLIAISNGTIQMVSYESAKVVLSQFLQSPYFLAGIFSKLVTALLTYPLTTVRVLLQKDEKMQQKQSFRELIALGRKHRSKLFKGIGANLLKGLFQRGLYFHSYQTCLKFLNATKE